MPVSPSSPPVHVSRTKTMNQNMTPKAIVSSEK